MGKTQEVLFSFDKQRVLKEELKHKLDVVDVLPSSFEEHEDVIQVDNDKVIEHVLEHWMVSWWLSDCAQFLAIKGSSRNWMRQRNPPEPQLLNQLLCDDTV